MLEVAKVLKLTLFSARSLKSLISRLLPNFKGDPIFFKILTAGTDGGIIPKSKGVLDVRARSHDPGQLIAPGQLTDPGVHRQLCLGARSDACNCSHEAFVALGKLREAGYPLYNTERNRTQQNAEVVSGQE